jgi:hypothetical protein
MYFTLLRVQLIIYWINAWRYTNHSLNYPCINAFFYVIIHCSAIWFCPLSTDFTPLVVLCSAYHFNAHSLGRLSAWADIYKTCNCSRYLQLFPWASRMFDAIRGASIQEQNTALFLTISRLSDEFSRWGGGGLRGFRPWHHIPRWMENCNSYPNTQFPHAFSVVDRRKEPYKLTRLKPTNKQKRIRSLHLFILNAPSRQEEIYHIEYTLYCVSVTLSIVHISVAIYTKAYIYIYIYVDSSIYSHTNIPILPLLNFILYTSLRAHVTKALLHFWVYFAKYARERTSFEYNI